MCGFMQGRVTVWFEVCCLCRAKLLGILVVAVADGNGGALLVADHCSGIFQCLTQSLGSVDAHVAGDIDAIANRG